MRIPSTTAANTRREMHVIPNDLGLMIMTGVAATHRKLPIVSPNAPIPDTTGGGRILGLRFAANSYVVVAVDLATSAVARTCDL